MSLLRILHQLPRSGGTVICRCLAAMTGVYLLSEIHPDADASLVRLNPIGQAAEWFDLFADDRSRIEEYRTYPFVDAIRLIEARVSERGGVLVIRDWSHLDFTGFPHNLDPGGRSRTAEALGERFDTIRTATVRKPLPQFESHRALLTAAAPEHSAMVDERFSPHRFLEAYSKFAAMADDVGFERYEDFTVDPDGVLERICGRLRIPYDPGWRDRWRSYDRITGEVMGRTDDIKEIGKPHPPELMALFDASPQAAAICRVLGYAAPY